MNFEKNLENTENIEMVINPLLFVLRVLIKNDWYAQTFHQ